MGDVVLVYQPAVEEALPLAQTCAAALERQGRASRLTSSWELDPALAPAERDLVVTFGGDGTILRAARWIGGRDVPIVGVQLGRLGFLAEVQPADLPAALDPYLARDFWADRRTMVTAAISDGPNGTDEPLPGGALLALNDIVLGRGQSPRTVTVDVAMNGSLLHQFRCDGVIVATATGSTAYSFAAGGPVLVPDSPDLVVTAICPHLSALRSFVLPGDVTLHLQVWTSQPAVVTIDGQIDHEVPDGATVAASASALTTTFARRGTRSEFYRRVLAKLT